MASSAGSRGRRGMRPLDDPELALLRAADLVAHLYVNRANPNAFWPVSRVLEERERRHAGAVAEEVAEGLRDEIRHAADTESRLRAELRASRRRDEDAEERLRELEAELARVLAMAPSSDSGGSGASATRTRRRPRRFADYEVELDQPEPSDLVARLAEAEAQLRAADQVADGLRDELRRAQAWVHSDVQARQRRAAETEAQLEALNERVWRLGLDDGQQASIHLHGEMELQPNNNGAARVNAVMEDAHT